MPPRKQRVVACNSKVFVSKEISALADKHSYDRGEVEYFDIGSASGEMTSHVLDFLSDKPMRPFVFASSPDHNAKIISGTYFQGGMDSSMPVYNLANFGKNRYYPDEMYNELVGTQLTALSAALPKWLITFKIYPTFKELRSAGITSLCVNEPTNSVRIGWVFLSGSADEKVQLCTGSAVSSVVGQTESVHAFKHTKIAFFPPSIMKSRHICFDTANTNRLSKRTDNAFVIFVQALMVYEGALKSENILGHVTWPKSTPVVTAHTQAGAIEKREERVVTWNKDKTGLVAVSRSRNGGESAYPELDDAFRIGTRGLHATLGSQPSRDYSSLPTRTESEEPDMQLEAAFSAGSKELQRNVFASSETCTVDEDAFTIPETRSVHRDPVVAFGNTSDEVPDF